MSTPTPWQMGQWLKLNFEAKPREFLPWIEIPQRNTAIYRTDKYNKWSKESFLQFTLKVPQEELTNRCPTLVFQSNGMSTKTEFSSQITLQRFCFACEWVDLATSIKNSTIVRVDLKEEKLWNYISWEYLLMI